MEEFWKKAEPDLRRFLRRRFGTGRLGQAEEEDLLQDTFLKVWGGIDSVRCFERVSLGTWARRIAERCWQDAYRKRLRLAGGRFPRREPTPVGENGQETAIHDGYREGVEVAASIAEEKESRRTVRRCLASLGERDQFLLVLRDWAGVSWETMAFLFECPSKGAARSLHARARRRLADKLRLDRG